jgi:hypothetical protein
MSAKADLSADRRVQLPACDDHSQQPGTITLIPITDQELGATNFSQ